MHQFDIELPICKLLVAHGADVNSKNNAGNTPLHNAIVAYKKNIELCTLLIAHGAELNNKNSKGKTPLLIAAERGLFDICKFLLEQGADVHAQDNTGKNSLMIVEKNNNELRELLIEYGAKENIVP